VIDDDLNDLADLLADLDVAPYVDPGVYDDPEYPLDPTPGNGKYERGGLWDFDEATFNLHRREAVCPACHLIYWLPTGAATHHGH